MHTVLFLLSTYLLYLDTYYIYTQTTPFFGGGNIFRIFTSGITSRILSGLTGPMRFGRVPGATPSNLGFLGQSLGGMKTPENRPFAPKGRDFLFHPFSGAMLKFGGVIISW